MAAPRTQVEGEPTYWLTPKAYAYLAQHPTPTSREEDQ